MTMGDVYPLPLTDPSLPGNPTASHQGRARVPRPRSSKRDKPILPGTHHGSSMWEMVVLWDLNGI